MAFSPSLFPRDRALRIAILLATALLWSGVLGIRMNADDFQYIHSMAPIRTMVDVLRPLWAHDANPSFFRPVPNVTMALNFLLSGWSGLAFHAFNLLLHLVVTWLVYHASRKLFRLSASESLWVMLAFGILASHEYNLVVDTARADVLVALFSIAAMLCAQRWLEKKSIVYKVYAIILFFLALLSKEIAIMILPLFLLIEWREKDRKDWKRLIAGFAPYVVATLVFYLYHAQFTQPITDSQPLSAEGAHSLAAMVRNAIYGLGYVVLPVDLDLATRLLAQYKLVLVPAAALIVTLLVVSLARSAERRLLIFPTLVLLLTASVILLSFERWRLYLPSLPLIVIGVVAFRRVLRTQPNAVRYVATGLLAVLGIFHVTRALQAQADWRSSTMLFEHLRGDITHFLRSQPTKDGATATTIEFIALPTKLGSATVMQLGQADAVRQADIDRSSVNTYGNVAGSRLDARTAVEVYALSRAEGYAGLQVVQKSPGIYRVTVPERSHMMLFPSGMEGGGVARRDVIPAVGDSVVKEGSVARVQQVVGGVIKAVDVQLTDTLALPLYFDGSTFRRL